MQFFIDAGYIPAGPSSEILAWLKRVIAVLKMRVDHLDQLPAEAGVIYGLDPAAPQIDTEARQILETPEGTAVANEFIRLVDESPDLTPESYRETVRKVKDITRQKGRILYHSIRAALTGCGSGPELEKLIPLYEEGSRLQLPRKVMSSRERLHTILACF